MSVRRFDHLVIGGGMAGLPLALRTARHGTTAFVECELLGGTCLNRGCIPTKTMIASAKIAQQVRRAAEFGVHTDGPRVSLPEVVDRKDRTVEAIRSGSYKAVGRSGDLELFEGHGRFVGGRRLEVDGLTIEADRIFLNTGTRDALPPIDGLERVSYLTSRTILDLRELPDHLLVVGGGFIGVEFAQMFARFGSQVTIVQRASRLVPDEDPNLSQVLEDVFSAEGIEVLTSTTCVAAEHHDHGVRISCEGVETTELVGSHLLIAAGRTPNTGDLGLEQLGVEVDGRGFIAVDGQLRTGVEDIWALGDLRGRDMFTHTARDDAEVAYRSVFKNEDATIADRVVAHTVFTDPEIASVGLTEAQARAAGYDVAIGIQPFAGVARANAIGETAGFISFVADATTDRILGCHIIGPEAGNLIHEAVIAMIGDIPYRDIGRAIHVHPTLAEGVNAAAGGIHRPSA